MNMLRFGISDVRLKQRDVPPDDDDASLTSRLFDVTRGTIGEGRARVRFSRNVGLRASPGTRSASCRRQKRQHEGARIDSRADPCQDEERTRELSVQEDGLRRRRS